ncbi:hypothetical protein [Psychrobacter sp.]|uniref:hypothetical protein n=1 Tax=Psychrobacter sp. TaxID=56811 RepID=UPI003F94E535
MPKISIKHSIWFGCIVFVMCYPIVAYAADKIAPNIVLPAPFLIDWSGVWLFSVGGGIGSAFVKMEQIDKRFYYPALAKFLIGVFSGVAISLLLDTLVNTRIGFLTFFALLASLFSAPAIAGGMVWISKQERVDKALDAYYKQKTGVDVSLDKEDEK